MEAGRITVRHTWSALLNEAPRWHQEESGKTRMTRILTGFTGLFDANMAGARGVRPIAEESLTLESIIKTRNFREELARINIRGKQARQRGNPDIRSNGSARK